ncbi:MAG: abortive infection family protein [Silvibacterium sp.]
MESTNFELWSGTNNFNDQFDLLYLETSPKKYIELEEQVKANSGLWKYREIAETLEKLGKYVRFIAVDVVFGDEIESVPVPDLKITSQIVERALTDAETLLRSGGAVSGIDRIHTVFHGYLKALCQERTLTPGNDAGVTELFKLIRKSHPAMSGALPGGKEIDRVVGAMSTIVDALNPLRNRASVAHPNDELLEEPEAMLVINTVRTLLHYLNARIQ